MKSTSAIVIVLLTVNVAFAESARERAKKRYVIGEAAFKMGRFEEALEEYTAAYALDPLPEMLFNIAQCHRNMRNFDRAIFFLDRYLQEAKRVDDREQIEALIEELEQARAEQQQIAAAQKAKAERIETPPTEARVPTSTRTAVTRIYPPLMPIEDEPPPLHERPWFWGLIVGTAAVVGGAIAIAVVSGKDGVPEGDYRFDLR